MMFRNILLASSAVAISALDTDNQGHGYGATAGKIAAGAVAAGLAGVIELQKNQIHDWEVRVTSSFDSSASTASSAQSASDSSGVTTQCFGATKEKCEKESYVPVGGFAVCSDEICQINIFNYYFFLYLKNKVLASYWIFFVHDSGLCKFLNCCTCDSTVQVTKAKNKKKKRDTALIPGHDKYPPHPEIKAVPMKVGDHYDAGIKDQHGNFHKQVVHPGEEQQGYDHHSFMQVNATLAEMVEEAGMEMRLVGDDGKGIDDHDEHEKASKCHGGHHLFYCQNICCASCKGLSIGDLIDETDIKVPEKGFPEIKEEKHPWSLMEDDGHSHSSKGEDKHDPHAHFEEHKIKKCPVWASKGKLSRENCYENGCCAIDKGPCDLVPCFKRCVKDDHKKKDDH